MSFTVPPHDTSTPTWRQSQRDHLTEICDTISQLDCDFHSDVPEFLDADRRRIMAVVSSFSYDVTTIPVEIISRIFVHCLPTDGRVRPSPHRAPLLLAQICRRWREIALGTVQLWCSFDFTLQSTPTPNGRTRRAPMVREPSHAGMCALHRAWCHRANGYPLSVTLRCSIRRYGLPTDFLITVATFAPQWERMELALPNFLSSAPDIARFAARIGGPFPALSTLALSIGNLPYVIEQTLGMYQNLPQLRDFRLSYGLALSRVPIGGAPLTSLELQTEVSLGDCNATLQRFPSLLHLGLLHIDFDLPTASDLGPLPPLKSLTLDIGGCRFLALVTLPHLRHLNYSIYAGDDIDTLVAFLGRSACSLTHLALRIHTVIEDLFLLQCLQLLPLLEDLHIEYRHGGARTLCNHLQSLDIVPQLRTLSFSELAPYGYTYPPLVQMLQARRRVRTASAGAQRLSSFDLGLAFSKGMLPYRPDAEKLRRLVEGGLRLRIHGPGFECPEGQYIDEQLEFPRPHPSVA
ncbi:hypothetical protein C8F04DRAFT_1140431 [Mycena alexandri]|uniref:F-box domain-containing protein n=1 Tax=Mycena alexandri TaxID=1745969 RepID=A0AAD6WUJ9_9AGAR|nr:hypothetical protein C8F04DRAFT_1140431 [Mycena alexandri]